MCYIYYSIKLSFKQKPALWDGFVNLGWGALNSLGYRLRGIPDDFTALCL